jgi:hypothetical protein
MATKDKRLITLVEPATFQQLAKAAKKEKVSIGRLVRMAIQGYLKK